MSYKVANHLGGHYWNCHVDLGILKAITEIRDIRTAVDVGCGTGLMLERMRDRNIQAIGVDGDLNMTNKSPYILGHDYTTGPLELGRFDLGWSCEFAEHVEARFVDNFMTTLMGCSCVFITAAPPGRGGHHHVNCQPKSYWVDVFSERGFCYDSEFTEYLLNERSVPILVRSDYAKRKSEAFSAGGMFFKKDENHIS